MLLNSSLNFSSKMRQLLILMPTSWRKLTAQSLSLTSTAWSLSREPRATLSAPEYSAPRRGCSVPAAGRMRPLGVSEAPVCRCPHGGAGPPGLTGLPLLPRSRRPRPSLQADVPALRSGGSELVPVRETPRDHRARPSFLPRAPPAASAPVRSLSRADSRAGSPLRGGSSTTKRDLPVEKTFPGVPKKTSIQLSYNHGFSLNLERLPLIVQKNAPAPSCRCPKRRPALRVNTVPSAAVTSAANAASGTFSVQCLPHYPATLRSVSS